MHQTLDILYLHRILKNHSKDLKASGQALYFMTEQKRNQITKQTTLFKSGEDMVEVEKKLHQFL